MDDSGDLLNDISALLRNTESLLMDFDMAPASQGVIDLDDSAVVTLTSTEGTLLKYSPSSVSLKIQFIRFQMNHLPMARLLAVNPEDLGALGDVRTHHKATGLSSRQLLISVVRWDPRCLAIPQIITRQVAAGHLDVVEPGRDEPTKTIPVTTQRR